MDTKENCSWFIKMFRRICLNNAYDDIVVGKYISERGVMSAVIRESLLIFAVILGEILCYTFAVWIDTNLDSNILMYILLFLCIVVVYIVGRSFFMRYKIDFLIWKRMQTDDEIRKRHQKFEEQYK